MGQMARFSLQFLRQFSHQFSRRLTRRCRANVRTAFHSNFHTNCRVKIVSKFRRIVVDFFNDFSTFIPVKELGAKSGAKFGVKVSTTFCAKTEGQMVLILGIYSATPLTYFRTNIFYSATVSKVKCHCTPSQVVKKELGL